MYNINKVKAILGGELCSRLLFIHSPHAFTGCDTTSRIRSQHFKTLVKGDPNLKSRANAFVCPKTAKGRNRASWQSGNVSNVWRTVHRFPRILELHHVQQESCLVQVICHS